MAGIAKLLSQIAMVFPLALAPVVLSALIRGEPGALRLVAAFTILAFVCAAAGIIVRSQQAVLSRRDELALIVLAWLIFPILGALPIIALRPDAPLDALFDAVSALTASGVVFGAPIETWPQSLVLWVGILQWIGAGLVILFAIVILGPQGIGGLPARPIRALDHGGVDDGARFRASLAEFGPIYGGLTLICLAAILICGIPAFDALIIALGTVSTGGLLPRGGVFSAYENPAAEWVIALTMIVTCTSPVWLKLAMSGRIRQAFGHFEAIILGGVIGALALLYAGAGLVAGSSDLLQSIRSGVFSAAALISTTGTPIAVDSIALIPAAVVALVVFVGGAAMSAAGGITIYRAGAMATEAGRELSTAIYPNIVHRPTIAGAPAGPGAMKAIAAAVMLHLLIFSVLMLIIAPHAGSFEAAYLAGIGALSNVGQIHDAGFPGASAWPSFATWPAHAKFALALGMIVGRIESIAACALILGLLRRE